MIRKKQVLKTYLEGVGIRSIGRMLKVHHATVLHWRKNFGQSVEMLLDDQSIVAAKLDDIHTYVNQKKLQMGLDCRG